MRCSEWSSRAIWACSAAALLLPATGAAHVSPGPAAATQGADTRIELDVPNERPEPMTGLVIEVPDGITVVGAEAPPGWLATTTDSTAGWSGGSLQAGSGDTFPVVLRAESAPGTAVLTAAQTYADGNTIRWEVRLTVLPGSGPPEPQSHLGWGLAAGVVGIALLTASLAVVHRRRGRRPTRAG